jgi:hypothetical protein
VRTYDVISSAVFMALGAYIGISGWMLGFGGWQQPGSGFIAVLSGCLLCGLSGLWFVMALIKAGAREPARRFFPDSGSARRVLSITVALVGFTVILERAGFLISCFLLMVFLMRAVEPQRWRTTLVFAFLTTVLCVLIFQIWLKVEFPEGLINIYALQKWIR